MSLMKDPAFIVALSFRSEDFFHGLAFSDILNGKTWRQNKAQMKSKFEAKKQQHTDIERGIFIPFTVLSYLSVDNKQLAGH
jgi:hypothetical protein